MPNKKTLPLDANTFNALVDALGALTLCVSRQLTSAQRTGFKADLARLAAQAAKDDNAPLEVLLTDLHNAALK